MKLISVNIGLPREATWHDRNVTTAIFKRVAVLRESWKDHFRKRLREVRT